ncbi:MAG: peptidylprolyl isomerase [Candidatus Nitrosopolaris wilkensis]|nr:MAG: peptidylprolyl isomerase [Candidatus Nitrosopolaris wilkensis]
MTLEKGSLILIDYTANIKDTNKIFETTSEEDAKNSDLYDPTRKYGPRLVSVGEGWVLKGLDEALAEASSGDKLDVDVLPDKGFGERIPNKVRMVAQRKLGDKADEVRIGDEVEIDERTGIVRFVGSGRVQVDFNHRLAGRTLTYKVNIIKKLESDNDKVLSLMKRRLPLDDEKIKFILEGSNLTIQFPEETFLTEGLQVIKRGIASDIFKYVGSITNVKFVETYKATNSTKSNEESEDDARSSKEVGAMEVSRSE